MKPKVLVVGSYIEGRMGGVVLENWDIDNKESNTSFSLIDLKELALKNNTFSIEEGTIPTVDAGVRWYGNDPFGD